MRAWRSPLLMLGLTLASLAMAETPAPVRDPGERLQREQLEKERGRALERGPVEIEVPVLREDHYGDAPESLPEPGPLFSIHAVTWQGEPLLSETEFKRIVAPFVGKPLGINRINLLLDRLNKALVAAGFITSRVYVANQSLAAGVLVITVVPGRVERILYNGEAIRPGVGDHPGVRLALPMAEGDILKLPDVEQAVDQFNRLRRNNVQVQIRPGEQPGGSIVEFANARGDAATYTFSADNQGSPGTGRLRPQVSAEAGDVFGLMETLAFGLTTSMETNALYASVSLPFGYNTASVMTSWSEYQNLIGDTALLHGTSSSLSLSLNRLVHRDQNTKMAVDFNLTRRNSTRMVNNAALTPQTHTVARLGVNRLTRFRTGAGIGQWTLDAGVTQGLAWFNADRDRSDIAAEAARAQFTKFELSGTAAVPLGGGYSWRGRVAGQWSRMPLFSSEQIFAGGVASVRGFAESALGGDRGLQVRNEIVRDDLKPLFGARVRVEPYAFLDGGGVETLADERWQSLIGAGLGVRVGFAGGNAEVIAGWPLLKPDAMADAGARLNISIAYQF